MTQILHLSHHLSSEFFRNSSISVNFQHLHEFAHVAMQLKICGKIVLDQQGLHLTESPRLKGIFGRRSWWVETTVGHEKWHQPKVYTLLCSGRSLQIPIDIHRCVLFDSLKMDKFNDPCFNKCFRFLVDHSEVMELFLQKTIKPTMKIG